MLVGEQPGHEEDVAGRPFVGPAGRLLEQAVAAAGLSRDDLYLTNVLKHFKWLPKGKRRLQQKPAAREVSACLAWLDAELELVKPKVIVCMGATAAQALFGRAFRVTTQRGVQVPFGRVPLAFATVHPSSILRSTTNQERAYALARFIDDLREVAHALRAYDAREHDLER
jgi:DNA polymerase